MFPSSLVPVPLAALLLCLTDGAAAFPLHLGVWTPHLTTGERYVSEHLRELSEENLSWGMYPPLLLVGAVALLGYLAFACSTASLFFSRSRRGNRRSEWEEAGLSRAPLGALIKGLSSERFPSRHIVEVQAEKAGRAKPEATGEKRYLPQRIPS